MDEDAARNWLQAHVSRETLRKLDRFTDLLREENKVQNLVSAASLDSISSRHLVDSAQLALLTPPEASWVDLGSGAGLPGLVVAMQTGQPVTLVESRTLRAAWLERMTVALALPNVTVVAQRAETMPDHRFDVITARAFAPLAKLLAIAHRFAKPATLWLLPKGKSAAEELASVRDTWHGNFVIQTSLTDAHSSIIVARNVRPARGRR